MFYSLGIAVGICLQDHVLMDLPVNPLFLEYLRADIPALRSVDGGKCWEHNSGVVLSRLARAGEDYSKQFSGLLDVMRRVKSGEAEDISQLMIDCSLPSSPDINLVPEFVTLHSPFNAQTTDPEAPLTTDAFPLWLSRYIHCCIGEKIRPAIALIRSGARGCLE